MRQNNDYVDECTTGVACGSLAQMKERISAAQDWQSHTSQGALLYAVVYYTLLLERLQ